MDEPLVEAPILEAANKVLSLFDWYLDTAKLCAADPGAAHDALSYPLIEDQYGRFNSWTENIGVFAEENASLDARLHENSSVSKLILDQLSHLGNHLDLFWKASFGDKSESPEDNGEIGPVHEEGTASGTSGSEDNSESESEPNTEADEPEDIRMVREAIDRLVRLSLAIRRSSTAQQNLRAARHVEYDEDGVEKVSAFGDMALKLVQTWYPDASATLQIRLADTMTKRRRQLLYRTKHIRKLKGTTRRHSGPKRQYLAPQTVNTAPHYNAAMPRSSPRTVQSLKSAALSNARSVSKMSATEASTFVATKFSPDAPSTIVSTAVSAAASGHVEVIEWPSPPKTAPGATEFVCPHCTLNVHKMEANDEKWKQHLMKDLEPWVCLFEKCDEPHTLFRDRSTWVNHMKTHAYQWQCTLPGHPLQRFYAEDNYDKHMMTAHAGFTSAQLAGLKRMSLRSSAIMFKSCPICREQYLPDEQPAPLQSGLSNALQIQRRLQSHMSRHLLRMAFYCIPFQDGDDENVSSEPEETNRRVAESTVDKVPSVAYGDMDPSTDTLLLEEYADILSQAHVEFPPCDMDSANNWNYVRNFQAKPYEGHAEDRRLEGFVRQYQIKTLIEAGKASDPRLPCRLIPLDQNKNFYGRENLLTRLSQKLCPPEDGIGSLQESNPASMKTIILRGAGGIGKTQAALEFVHRNKKRFDAVFWCHGDDTGKLSTDFDRIAIQLGLVANESGDSRDQILTRELVKGWLENPKKTYDETNPTAQGLASWLLVLDDVSSLKPDALMEFIPVETSPGSILITLSEHIEWSTANSEAEIVDPFTPDEAAAFLSKVTKRGESSHEQQFGSVIGRRVGGSPHELTFLARIIREKNYSFEEFIQAQTERETQQAVLSLNLHDLKVDKDDFMFSSWALDVVEESGKALLDVLSMFDSDGVPERLLTAWSDGGIMQEYPQTIEDYKDARMELLDYSLVSQNRSTGNLLVHRRVQDAARRRMTQERYLSVFYTCVVLLNKSYPRQRFTWRHSVVNWPQIQQLFPHIIRLREHARPIKIVTENRAGDYQYARLCAELAWYCHERGLSLISEDFCNIAQGFCHVITALYKQDPSLEAESSPTQAELDTVLADVYHTKGIAATEMNKPLQALTYLKLFNEMMLKKCGSTVGGTNMRLPISWNQLGVGYMMNDDWEQGEQCFKKSIATMKELDDYQEYKISLPLANLACAFWLTGRFEEAVQALEEGLAYRAAEFGPDDRESFITGRFYHGLGNVKASQGLLDESFEYHKQARDHYRWTIGRQHHRTADANIRLADHFIRKNTENDLKHAKELLDQALKAYLGRDIYFPEKARALYKRSNVYRLLDKDDDARCDAGESLRLYRLYKPDDKRPLEDLKDEDFDKIIVFWSR